MSAIKEARERAGLTAAEVSHAVGRTSTWMGLAENGALQLPPEHEKIILTAIGRLGRFHLTVAEAKEKLVADLKLPPVPPTRGRPHPGGSHAP
jgi:transcriptional regulator with XRE-family HTH domain